jgi:hypothetical protein
MGLVLSLFLVEMNIIMIFYIRGRVWNGPVGILMSIVFVNFFVLKMRGPLSNLFNVFITEGNRNRLFLPPWPT